MVLELGLIFFLNPVGVYVNAEDDRLMEIVRYAARPVPLYGWLCWNGITVMLVWYVTDWAPVWLDFSMQSSCIC